MRAKAPLRSTSTLRRAPIKRTIPKRRDGAAGRAYMAKVATLPCAVANSCCSGRITVHHKSGGGMGRKSSDFETIALCEGHHLFGPEAIHGIGSKAWEKLHGVTERELVERTRRQVAVMR